jgi:hypothetical protein
MTREERLSHIQSRGLELAVMLDREFDDSRDASAALAIGFARILADQKTTELREEYIEEFVRMAREMMFPIGSMLTPRT